jgi:Ca2+-binding RTX toxin-like protein
VRFAAWGYLQGVAEDRAIERAVAAPDGAKGVLRDRRGSAHAVLVTALLFVSLLVAVPAIAGRVNEIDGTARADRIRGTPASDRIRGGEGNDVLHGWAGDDRLLGGPGDDVLVGGSGQDSYVCGGGEDVVVVDFSRLVEHFGDGCEAAILDV